MPPMLRSTLRPLGLLVAVVFAVNAFLPGVPHGCEGEAKSARPAAAHRTNADASEGHHHGDRQTPGRDSGCHCVGHSCCAALRIFLPSAKGAPVLAAAGWLTPILGQETHLLADGRTQHLQPPAIGPPVG